MSLSAFEASRKSQSPVELFLFRYGSDPLAYFAFTDHTQQVVYDGITYLPEPIKRGEINSQQGLDKSEMAVETRLNNPVSELFRIYPPSSPVMLTIRAGHLTDPDQEFGVIWVGRVQQVTRIKQTSKLSCTPASSAMRRTGLRRHYQLTCPHVLYDQENGSCRANKGAATTPAVPIVALAYLEVTFAAAWFGALDPVKFIGGLVEWDGALGREYRTIIRVEPDGLTLSLNAPTTGLDIGSLVDVVLGCNHQLEDCETLHNNVVNFGGMPFIPQDNPVSKNPFT